MDFFLIKKTITKHKIEKKNGCHAGKQERKRKKNSRKRNSKAKIQSKFDGREMQAMGKGDAQSANRVPQAETYVNTAQRVGYDADGFLAGGRCVAVHHVFGI